ETGLRALQCPVGLDTIAMPRQGTQKTPPDGFLAATVGGFGDPANFAGAGTPETDRRSGIFSRIRAQIVQPAPQVIAERAGGDVSGPTIENRRRPIVGTV